MRWARRKKRPESPVIRAVKPPFERLKYRPTLFQILSLVVSVVVGTMIFASKGRAQPAGPLGVGGGPGGSASGIPSLRLTGSVTGSAAGVASSVTLSVTVSSSASSSGSASASPSSSASSGLDYAEVQTEADFDPKLSEEQRNAIGAGKVPIHREGKFKSPFAHPRFGGKTTVKVGLVLVAIHEYTIHTGKFEADFYLSFTADKAMPGLAIQLTNGGGEAKETLLADTPTFKLYRYRSSFDSPVDLRGYPFDRQRLAIEIEDSRAGVDQLVFVADQQRTALDEGFALSGWSVAALGAYSYAHLYPPRFDRDDLYVSRYKFVLTIERFGTSAAFSVFVPAFIIVIISLMGLWVPPQSLEVRSNSGAPMLAAAVLFHYSLIQTLPATGYLTRADKLMTAVYVALLLNMISTWLFMLVKDENVQKVFLGCRTVVPIMTCCVMAAGVLL